jgi:hypothetical protein
VKESGNHIELYEHFNGELRYVSGVRHGKPQNTVTPISKTTSCVSNQI